MVPEIIQFFSLFRFLIFQIVALFGVIFAHFGLLCSLCFLAFGLRAFLLQEFCISFFGLGLKLSLKLDFLLFDKLLGSSQFRLALFPLLPYLLLDSLLLSFLLLLSHCLKLFLLLLLLFLYRCFKLLLYLCFCLCQLVLILQLLLFFLLFQSSLF